MIFFTQYRLAKGELVPECNGNYVCLGGSLYNEGNKWICLKATERPNLVELSSNYSVSFLQLKNMINYNLDSLRRMAYEKFVRDIQDFLERQILSIWNNSPHVTVISQPIESIPADTANPPGRGFVHFTNMTLVLGNQPMVQSNCIHEEWVPNFWDSDFVQERRNLYAVERIMQS